MLSVAAMWYTTTWVWMVQNSDPKMIGRTSKYDEIAAAEKEELCRVYTYI